MEEFTLVLYDGTRISGLEKNLSAYVSNVEIDNKIFENNLYSVEILRNGEPFETLKDKKLGYTGFIDGKWFITFDEPSMMERLYNENKARIEYLAMMSGIDLPE